MSQVVYRLRAKYKSEACFEEEGTFRSVIDTEVSHEKTGQSRPPSLLPSRRSTMPAAPAAAPAPAMPANLHHIAVIGHDAGGSGAIGAACEIPATATKTEPAIAIAEKVPIIVFLPMLFSCGIDIQFGLRFLRNAPNRERVSADHGSGQCVSLIGKRPRTDAGETSHARKRRNDPGRSFGDAG